MQIQRPEQRQRDELISSLKNGLERFGIENADQVAGCLAIGMINRGWRKEPKP